MMFREIKQLNSLITRVNSGPLITIIMMYRAAPPMKLPYDLIVQA